ncbi:hypothetical protein ACH4FV_32715 [Streptomyces anulatus]|uniref:hypothetical protein n=1 Tax=Streptomyces anulatus TaxID=1892 RepID=UPI0037B2662B|nr:hypothetical protein OHA54_29120 [Streptomyces anulatus]WTE06359.1 hypothetical protein OH765_29220 [Streptomyces anulatus]
MKQRRPVQLTSLVRYTGRDDHTTYRTEAVSVDVARQCIRRARVHGVAVTIYPTTDRTGDAIQVAHVRFGPGHWSNVDAVSDIYEIPVAALLDL